MTPAAVVLLLSCGGSDAPTGPSDGNDSGRTGLFRVGDAPLADTIEGSVSVTFEVLDASGPRQGVVIWLTSALRSDRFPMLRFTARSGGILADSLSLLTGADGRVTFFARLGRLADTVTVTASAATGTRLSMLFTVQPGAPTALDATPADTTVYAGGSYRLSAHLRDRVRNPVNGTPTFASLRTEVAEVSTAGDVTARGIGRTSIAVRLGALVDTVGVSVPPEGRIAYARFFAIYEVNLNGSDPTLVIEDARKVAAPAWSADGGTLAWGTLGSLMTATGPVVTTILHDATINGPSLPRFSPDGRWIYFNGKSMNGSSVSNSVLFRIDLGDRTVEELTPTGDVDDSAPDVSPDGTMIAFGSTRWTPYPYQSMVRLLDPSTLVVTDLGVRGTRPRWSPDGQWLAYVVAGAGWRPNPVGREFGAGPLAIVRPGGTDRRVIHTGLKTFHPGIDWSPDGKYLIASNSMSQMDIVVVETGEIIPLTFLRGEGVDIYHPDWKPPA
ncbi:MAG TPA: hypothetical protein VJ997_12595 [Longimicrobiales bacterium]|nr:hypothetical protein [Longimicrobiales bacterium]